MKILHFIDSLDYGGAETLLMSYIPLLNDHEHIVVTLNGPNVFDQTNYEYIQLNKKPVKGFFQAVKAVRKIINDKNIDLVHAHSYWTNIISRFATPRKIKLLNHYHFADFHTMKKKAAVKRMIAIDKLFYHKQLIRIGVSEFVFSILKNIFPGSNIVLMPNFIKCIPSEQTVDKSDSVIFKVIAVGNCNKEKNYNLVLQALEMMKDEPLLVDIYGGGSNLNDYRAQVKRLGLSNVRFCGTEPDINGKLKGYDLFLAASVSETFGIAVLEAICAKLPLLLSDIPAFREIAPKNTLFFNPHDKNDLVNKLKLMQNPGIKNNCTDYEFILQKYSAENFITKLKNLYH